jgi:Uma2 family endonuclease
MLIETSTPIIYPEQDGQPMSDNTKQFRWIVTIKENLELIFAPEPTVFVAGDLLWYPVEGNNTIRNAPDAMVVFGSSKGDRGSYRQWEEGNIPPQVVFEILSPGNRMGEMNRKQQFYERYGVEEYYIYDPDKNDLTGWIKEAEKLVTIDEIDGWISPRLGIRFELAPNTLMIYRPDGEKFLGFVELDGRRRQAEEQLQQTEQQLEQTEQQLKSQQQTTDRLAAKLRELGIDPDLV